MVVFWGVYFDEEGNIGRVGFIELYGIKVLGENVLVVKGNVFCSLVSFGFFVGKENIEERVWFLSRV